VVSENETEDSRMVSKIPILSSASDAGAQDKSASKEITTMFFTTASPILYQR
jgi:hypothetical protein